MSRAAHLVPPVYALLVLLPAGLFGQELSGKTADIVLESGTPVKLQITQTISSAQVHKNDRLELTVTNDVEVAGYKVIRAGAGASGSVIGVKRRRPMGMGGDIIIQIDSVELATGERVGLRASKEFKGKSRSIRMGVAMAIAAAFYVPAAPLCLLLPGRNSTVLKGTEITAYTKELISLSASNLPVSGENASEVSEMMKLLPPRALNGEGRQGDMLNLIFLAKEDDLQGAFAKAGWLKVEKSRPQIAWHLLLQRQHYTKLPMDRLFVFGRAQDYSFALPDPRSIVARRHHLRIWKTDRQVGGVPLWVAAATHDVSIQFVKRKLRLFHKIDPNVDAEREFVAGNLAETRQIAGEKYMECTEPVSPRRRPPGRHISLTVECCFWS